MAGLKDIHHFAKSGSLGAFGLSPAAGGTGSSAPASTGAGASSSIGGGGGSEPVVDRVTMRAVMRELKSLPDILTVEARGSMFVR